MKLNLLTSGARWLQLSMLALLAIFLASCNRPTPEPVAADESPAAIRALYVTENSRVFGHEARVINDVARGHPVNFSQWHVVVLNKDRRPLDVYGTWDPRLILEHDARGVPFLTLDTETAYLFDVVVPFEYDKDTIDSVDSLPREIQIRDQELTTLFQIDLTPMVNDYCLTGAGVGSAACTVDSFPLAPMLPQQFPPPNPQTPLDERPQATTDFEILMDSSDVTACLALDVEETIDEKMNRLESCHIVPLDVACATIDILPGASRYTPGFNLTDQSWTEGQIALNVLGDGSFVENGIRVAAGAALALQPLDCLLTSVEMQVRPADSQTLAPSSELASAGADWVHLVDWSNLSMTKAQPGGAQLVNGGQSVEQPLSATGPKNLRVGALPLQPNSSLFANGGDLVVERIRINAPATQQEAPTPTNAPTNAPTEALTPVDTVTPTYTPTNTPTDTPTPSITPTPEPLCTVLIDGLNVRYGPGTVYAPPIGSFASGTQLTPLFRNAAGSWIEVQQRGGQTRGWVSVELIDCNFDINKLDIVPDLPTPTPIPTPTFTPTPSVYIFPIEPQTIAQGGCAYFEWIIENVQAVYIDEQGVDGVGHSDEFCPPETHTYTWRVVTAEGEQNYTRLVQVEVPVTPQITVTAVPNPIAQGDCTEVSWNIQGVREIYYEGAPVTGSESRRECPETTRPYSWQIVTDNETLYRDIVVEVIPPPPTNADLIISNFYVTGAIYQDEGNRYAVPVSVSIYNQGQLATDVFKVSIDYSASSSTYVAPFTVPGQGGWYPYTGGSLAPGNAVTFNGVVLLPDSVAGEQVTLIALADSCSGDELMPAYCRVDESNESNNSSSTSVYIENPGTPLDNFLGLWYNVDSNTGGITTVNINQDNGVPYIQVYGSCTPTDCDWGIVSGAVSGTTLYFRYEFSFKITDLTVSLHGDRLIVFSSNRFTDGSGRDYDATYEFYKAAPIG